MGLLFIEVRTQEKEHIESGEDFSCRFLTSAFIYLLVIDSSSLGRGQMRGKGEYGTPVPG